MGLFPPVLSADDIERARGQTSNRQQFDALSSLSDEQKNDRESTSHQCPPQDRHKSVLESQGSQQQKAKAIVGPRVLPRKLLHTRERCAGARRRRWHWVRRRTGTGSGRRCGSGRLAVESPQSGVWCGNWVWRRSRIRVWTGFGHGYFIGVSEISFVSSQIEFQKIPCIHII